MGKLTWAGLRFFFAIWFVISSPGLGETLELPEPPCGGEDAFIAYSAVRSINGAEVGLTYRALHWAPITMQAIELEEEQTKEFRMYYTERVAPALGVLFTNVLLEGPRGLQLAPGFYRVGFKYLGQGKWAFIATSDNPARDDAVIPIEAATELFETPELSMNLVAGSKKDELSFKVLYGPYSVNIPFRVVGVPIVELDSRLPSHAPDHAFPSANTDMREQGEDGPQQQSDTPPKSNETNSLDERWEARSPTPVIRARSGTSR